MNWRRCHSILASFISLCHLQQHQTRTRRTYVVGHWPSVSFIQSASNSSIHCSDFLYATNSCKLRTNPKQVALLWQRDRARHLSVEILQLQNISLENVILRLAVLIQYRTVTDTHTHTECMQTDRHTTTAYTARFRAVKIDHIARPTNYN